MSGGLGRLDPLGVAAAFALGAGVLSVPIPYFDGLVETLVALAGALALGVPRGVPVGRTGRPGRRAVAPALFALAWAAYLLVPSLLGPARGIVLALGVAPMAIPRWTRERGGP